uniref:Transcription factor bHLH041 isoform X2 n=1 Tax=Elaeis guineensis var. tenera TaxID=51953 RepID=A0A8N4F4P4_ELAGV|nr:putative transcription factor bHLH041 isoform X2 [Elaeis guineensis]
MDYSTLYQAAVFMGCKNGEIELGISTLSNPQLEEFFSDEQSRPSSSSSSVLPSFSGGSPEYSSLLNNKVYSSFIPDPSKELITKLAAQPSPAINLPPRQVAMQAHSQHPSVQFPAVLLDDDAVITRAMMAVISSSSSSSSSYSSSPSIISQTVQQARHHQAHGDQLGPFKPYNLALAPKLEPKNGSCGQKMIKKSISILKRINLLSAEARAKEPRATSSNQLHHVMSERRRREKLNGSFQDLRMLLPPGSKKDKASVLTSTRNYLNTLKAQIYELKEKNQKLEMQLLSSDEAQETTGSSSGSVEVQIVKASDLSTELQHINVGLTVKAAGDIIAPLLHVLECLKEMGLSSLLSVDAYTYNSSRMNQFARVDMKLQIKESDWNEELFKEAMVMAVGRITTTSPGLLWDLD